MQPAWQLGGVTPWTTTSDLIRALQQWAWDTMTPAERIECVKGCPVNIDHLNVPVFDELRRDIDQLDIDQLDDDQ
jgi:hypothetical protein